MANIKISLGFAVVDGQPLTFKAPCDCSNVTGINVEYPNGEDTAFQVFTFADAHGNDLTGIGNLFAEGAMVKVILDTADSKAFIQNADTNAYIENNFLKLDGGTMTGPLNMGEQDINNAKKVFCTALNDAKIERVHADADYAYFGRWKDGSCVYLFLAYIEGSDPCAYVVSTKYGVEGVNVHKIAGSDSSSLYISDTAQELHFRLPPYSTCLMIRTGF